MRHVPIMHINSYPVELNDCALAEDLRGPSARGRGEGGEMEPQGHKGRYCTMGCHIGWCFDQNDSETAPHPIIASSYKLQKTTLHQSDHFDQTLLGCMFNANGPYIVK